MGNLGAAGLGALASLVVVALGAWLQARRERRHWLRDQRFRGAVDYITSTRYLLSQHRRVGEAGMDEDDRREWRSRMQTARSTLSLLGSPRTVTLANDVARALDRLDPDADADDQAAAEAAFQDLVWQLREELGSPQLDG
ncbi:hypothetical protein [Micromonospora auratinigra]|uniref:Uncharacterized protein n=1 Tax=Micromonospora auratinigra TaxID=261654 RepID=A0A1A8Z0M2_9ACTN|nr:hypothetical protein [Micromonospora auratinigra]SBT37268.1 hypothetical protein GA0070611_0144 [Micromonospora auratinigra]